MADHQQAGASQECAKDTGGKLMKWGMMACCVVMFVPIGLYFLAGGAVGGVTESLGLFAPVALCIGAHFFMHKVMGKSCHPAADENKQEQPQAVEAEPARLSRQ